MTRIDRTHLRNGQLFERALLALSSLAVCVSPGMRARAHEHAAAAEEFRVNSVTADIQQTSAVALGRAGDFVVAWQSEIEGQGDDIRAQCFDSRGVPRGEEIAVNAVTASHQNAPAVAMDGAGNFVVVWQSLIADNFAIRARRFDAQGVARGGEITVSTRRGESQSAPAVAMRTDGAFVVAWEAPVRGDYEIRARRFDAEGVALGAEIAVNELTAGSQRFPKVALNGSGFVVVFRSNVAGSYEIRARRFSADGEPRGQEIEVNAVTRGDQLAPAVALDARGGFLVVWENSLEDRFEIRARRFNARAVPQGPELALQPATAGEQFAPAVASLDARGSYVVAWHSRVAGSFEIRAQRLTAEGLARGREIAVNDITAGTQKAAAIAANVHGDFVVTWHSDATGSWEIAARGYQAARASAKDPILSSAATDLR